MVLLGLQKGEPEPVFIVEQKNLTTCPVREPDHKRSLKIGRHGVRRQHGHDDERENVPSLKKRIMERCQNFLPVAGNKVFGIHDHKGQSRIIQRLQPVKNIWLGGFQEIKLIGVGKSGQSFVKMKNFFRVDGEGTFSLSSS